MVSNMLASKANYNRARQLCGWYVSYVALLLDLRIFLCFGLMSTAKNSTTGCGNRVCEYHIYLMWGVCYLALAPWRSHLARVPLLGVLQEEVDHHEEQQERQQHHVREAHQDKPGPERPDILEELCPDGELVRSRAAKPRTARRKTNIRASED